MMNLWQIVAGFFEILLELMPGDSAENYEIKVKPAPDPKFDFWVSRIRYKGDKVLAQTNVKFV
jgi:hypothetical protein